jgi:O-antigen/teichoic acid export membrane protein
MTTGRLIARNSALNLLGQAAPLLVALLTIPALVTGFGVERFGILTLAWAAIGYFGLFELGLSRALTQAIAQRLGAGAEDELAGIARTAIRILIALGFVGGVLVVAGTPLLVARLLEVPEPLRDETVMAFRVMGLSLPFVLGTVGLRGLLEAHQHFGVATALRVPTAILTFVAPLFVLPFTHSIVPAIAALVIARVIGFIAHAIACWRTYPYLRVRGSVAPETIRSMVRFGGWTTVTNVVGPLMVYADRFVIGSVMSLAAVTAYVTPYEVVVKLLLIPMALTGVFLPAFASTVESHPQRMAELYERCIRSTMVVMFPVVLVTIALADVGLRIWMKEALPPESARILQWLAAGVFVTAIAQSPFTALQGAARPDIIAKLHLAEIPVYAIALAAFMRWRGLEGVAIAWTLRATVDAVALLWMAQRRLGVRLLPQLGGGWAFALMLGAMLVGALLTGTTMKVLFAVVSCMAFAAFAWLRLLTSNERQELRGWLGRSKLRVFGGAAALCLVAVSVNGCDPCGTTIGCRQPPRVTVMGRVLNGLDGAPVPAIVEMEHQTGVALEGGNGLRTTQTGTDGTFSFDVGAAAMGEVVVQVVVRPDGARPFVVPGIVVRTLDTKGDAVVLPPWSRPTLPYGFQVVRGSNLLPIDSAEVRFEQTLGTSMFVGETRVAILEGNTGDNGQGLVFPLNEVRVDTAGTVTGWLRVNIPSLNYSYSELILLEAKADYQRHHFTFRLDLPGL